MENLDKNTCFEMGRICACANLRKAARSVTRFYDRILSPTGLRSTQLALLVAVNALGPTSVTTLAKKTLMDRTTLGRNLKLLESMHVIRIRPGEDLRIREVMLSDEGIDILMKALPYWKIAQDKMIKGMGKEGMSDLL
ncbi:MAG: MarR family winged helix-turn-helix transcriptional regulator, partial [Thermodesulfobacteriota bacterium]|nr:MarR family winged helix-turn-helix transcriptional regulator [Thermodesulfobacteriota bacterium]